MIGFNSFSGNVALKDFKLPSDNPQGGIDFVAVTTLNNPSPFSLNLGTVLFDLSYKDVFLGTGTGTDTVIVRTLIQHQIWSLTYSRRLLGQWMLR